MICPAGYYLSVRLSELDNNKGNVVGHAYNAVVTMKMILIGQFLSDSRAQRVIGRDRSFVIKISIGSDQMRSERVRMHYVIR